MATNRDWEFNSDSEEQEEQENEYSAARLATICIISASPDMFRVWGENEDKPIVAALKACEVFCRSNVISTPKNKVGIMFINTEKVKNPLECDNVYLYEPLAEVTTALIMKLRTMCFDTSDLSGFEDEIGSSPDCRLANVFWVTKVLFEESAKNWAKRIILFTCDDNPNADIPAAQDDAIKKYEDLGRVDFSIVTFNATFDYSKFFRGILDDESAVSNAKTAEQLSKVIRMKQRLRRPLSRSTLELTPGVKIGVGFYALARKAPKPKVVHVNVRTNEPISQKTFTAVAESGLPVLQSDVTKYIEVAGETAEFTVSETKDWKYASGATPGASNSDVSSLVPVQPHSSVSNASAQQPAVGIGTGISIMGFIDQSKMDHLQWYRSGGYFIYPDEERIAGSTDIFTSLLRRCDALQKVALVKFAKNRGDYPKLGCLVPSVKQHFRFGGTTPQGFHLAVIPYSDEIRHHDVDTDVKATDAMVQTMTNIVKKLTRKNFNVMDVQNPELYYKWKEIESSALNLPRDDEEFEDFTVPNTELMQELANVDAARLNSLVHNAAAAPVIAPAAKRARPTPASELNFDMRIEYQNDRLGNLLVKTLKAFVEQKKIPMRVNQWGSALKAEYVAAIKQYFQQQDKQ